MPTVVLKALECESTEDITHSDSCRLEISVDGASPLVYRHDLNTGERWILGVTLAFQQHVTARLWDEDWPDPDDFLGRVDISAGLRHRAIGIFDRDDAKYHLWYEVIASNTPADRAHQIRRWSVRQMLGRAGYGALAAPRHREMIGGESIYRCSEYLSVRDTINFHATQDGGRSATSLWTWVNRHCNPWGEGSVIPLSQTPRAYRWHEIAGGAPNWSPVHNERSYCMAGLAHFSRVTREDYPLRHATRDWLWDHVLDPAYLYMVDYTANRLKLSDGTQFPISHNEWESGSLPVQWRPFWGEYVSVWGRHVYDVGHVPVHTEMHPPHTVVREHTTAAPLGSNGSMVPVNRAVIGIGISGGFPTQVGSRWRDEFGEALPDWVAAVPVIGGCWVTNLKRHPLRYRIFPPVPRPSASAELRARIVLCEYIRVPDFARAAAFLLRCRGDDPASGGGSLGFRLWDRGRSLPSGFSPVAAPANVRPRLTLRHNAYFDVEVDLSSESQIPLGYYAIVECGWSEKGQHGLRRFDVTFQQIKAVRTEETWDDWHLYYGINGQWAAWWTSNFIEEGRTYNRNTRFQAWTVDDLPLVIRDCGVEWDGTDAWNENMDSLEITAHGPAYLDAIVTSPGVQVISRTANTLNIRAKAWQTAHPLTPEYEDTVKTRHEWTMRVNQGPML